MENKDKNPGRARRFNPPDPEGLKNVTNVVSSTDFTGLIQDIAEETGPFETYSDLYHFPEQGGLNIYKTNQLNESDEER